MVDSKEVTASVMPGDDSRLAAVLAQLSEHDKPLSLRAALKQSQSDGSQEHVTVEAAFTDGAHPLEYLDNVPANIALKACDGGLSVAWIHDEISRWFIAAWPTAHKNVYHLVSTTHTTDKRWIRTLRWLHRNRRVVRPFLNHADFQRIGANLAQHGEVEVGRVTARSALDGSSDARTWRSIGGQARPSHMEVLSSMENQGYSIRTMILYIEKALSIHLRRIAGATYYSGDVDLFVDDVLTPLADAANVRRTLMSNRQRSKESVRPISIRLSDANLVDSTLTGEVVREVASLPKTTLAVFHRNPYLHFAVVDEIDGSNFDVMVTDARSIDVYPGYLASPAALSRIVDHISDRFGGDEVRSRSERDYSLEELSLGR